MLSRWSEIDPFREMTSLRSAMDRLLEQAVVRPGSFLSSGQGTVLPPINVWEQDNKYIVQVHLPGVRPDEVELSVRQGTLTIKGRWPEPVLGGQEKQAVWLLQEVPAGEFTRSLTLPKHVAGDQVDAQYDRGVLTITLPFAAHEQPKLINIRESSGKTVQGSTQEKQPRLSSTDSR